MSTFADESSTVPDVPGFTLLNIQLGARLRLIRKSAKLDHSDLARKAQPLWPPTAAPLDRNAISRIETGRRALKFYEASVLCEALGVDIVALSSDYLAAHAADSLTKGLP